MQIGVIAYGSLIADPGRELSELIVSRRHGLRTPFRVEFARASNSRGGAPTLVPVSEGGGFLECVLLVLRIGTTIEAAKDAVYRREIHRVGDKNYSYDPDPKRSNQVYVETIRQWGGVDLALYARIEPNISAPDGEKLATLAIKSVYGEFAGQGKDGISYLMQVVNSGVRTPLTGEYIRQILAATATDTLEAARDRIITSGREPG